MKERGIQFSADMVKAILAGAKTQTRRVMKPQPDEEEWPIPGLKFMREGATTANRDVRAVRCPYGVVGDLLYVREAFTVERVTRSGMDAIGRVKHDSDGTVTKFQIDLAEREFGIYDKENFGKRRPPMFFPKAAARIWLGLTDVRVERVQAISTADALAEGVVPHARASATDAFHNLWDSINAKRGYGWDANPWVWVVEFKRAEAQILRW